MQLRDGSSRTIINQKKNIKTCKLKFFQWKYFKHHYWNFRRYERNIYLPQSLYQNSGSFLFLLARTNVFSTNKTQRTSFLISQAHPHILKLICWNKFLYKKKNNGVSNTILIKHSRIPVFVHFENILQKLFFPSPLSKRSVGTYATFRLTILEISFRIAWYLYQKSHSSTWSTYLK